MESVIKVSVCAVVGVLITMATKNEKSPYGFLIGLVIGIVTFGGCMQRIKWVLEETTWLAAYLGEAKGWFGILLKVLGITYVCDFSAGICKDAGYGFLAGQLEILGKLTVMTAGLSVMVALIEQIHLLT